MTNDERDALLVRLDERSKGVHDYIEKVEPRISRLERWRSKMTGAVSIIGAAVGMLTWDLRK